MPSKSAAEGSRTRPGTLYIVGTPIGNLDDMTLRAIQTLRQVDRVVAEDTRRTRNLLAHLGIAKKAIDAVHAHSRERAVERVVERLEAGESVALVTDAGMPGVSDPGAALARAARGAGVPVQSIPGPSALTTAIALSGLVEGPFFFAGFLPRRGARRKKAIDRLGQTPEPLVLFEAPHRLAQTLTELAAKMPEREVAICRELTKLHEEVVQGPLREVAQQEREWRGELTLVIAGTKDLAHEEPLDDAALERQIRAGLSDPISVRDLAAKLSEETGVGRRELYQRIQALRDTKGE